MGESEVGRSRLDFHLDMDTNLVQEFFDECSKAFAFLVADHGFAPPTLEINPWIHFATVTFQARNLALECIFDERESWVELKVARVINCEKAKDYAVNQSGNRVRDSLFLMLQRRGARDFSPKHDRAANQDLREMFRSKLALYSSLLRRYGKDVIEDSPLALTA